MSRTATCVSALCLFCAACTGEDVPPEGRCSTLPGQEFQVGTADSDGEAFLPFEDGDDVELWTNGQGAFHVFVNYAARGYDPAGLFVHRSVAFAATGEVITQNPERVNLLEPEEPGPDTLCTLRSAQIAVICPTILGRVWDADLELTVGIEDSAGGVAEVTRYFHAVCPYGDLKEPCLAICDGVPVE